MLSEVINLYEQTLLGALSDTPKLADNITLLLTFKLSIMAKAAKKKAAKKAPAKKKVVAKKGKGR